MDWEQHYQKGELLLQQDRYQLAEETFTTALAAAPNNPLLHAKLAETLVYLRQYARAEREACTAIALDPESPNGHFVLAMSNLRQTRLKEADAAIKEALRIAPQNVQYLTVAGLIEVGRENWSKALQYAEGALREHPQSVPSINTRALALVQLGRAAEAANSLDVALALDPENSLTHTNKGWVLLRTGNVEGAVGEFQQGLRLDPNSSWAYEGVIEAIKSRNALYYVILHASFALSQINTRVLQGIFMVAAAIPPLRILLLLFLIVRTLLNALFNLLLSFDPLGRRVMSEKMKRVNRVNAVMFLILFTLPLILQSIPRSQTHDSLKEASRQALKGDASSSLKTKEEIFDKSMQLLRVHKGGEAMQLLSELIASVWTDNGPDNSLLARCHIEVGKWHNHDDALSYPIQQFQLAQEAAEKAGDKKLHALALLGEAEVISRQEKDTKLFSDKTNWDEAIEKTDTAMKELSSVVQPDDPIYVAARQEEQTIKKRCLPESQGSQ